MRRRKVVLTIEAETVLTIGELRQLQEMIFLIGGGERLLSREFEAEKAGASLGTITQVQVNVVGSAAPRTPRP